MDFWYPPNGYTFGMKTEQPEYFEDKHIEHYAINSAIEDCLTEHDLQELIYIWHHRSSEWICGYLYAKTNFEHGAEVLEEIGLLNDIQFQIRFDALNEKLKEL